MANTRITQGVIKPNEDYDVRHINATGIITAQNISIGGTLTYNDVTNVDSIGIITARKGILIGAGQSIGPVSGIITYYGDGSKLSGIDATQLKGPAGNVVIQGYDTGAVHTGFSTMQNLRVTGIATFGTSSTVINGDQNIINVGTALTLGHTQGLQFHTQNLHSAGFEINQINASGIITASEFRGSGAGLSGMPVAIGTALGAAGSGLDAFFYVNKVLPVTSTVTVDPPSSSDRAYTHYTDIQVSDSADLIIAEGDDLIPDVLGLANNGTFGGGSSAGRLRVNLITDKDATGAPTVSNGLIISGVTTTSDIKVGTGATLNVYGGATFSGIVTASSFSGDGSNLTGIQVGGGTSLSFNDNVAVYFGNSNDMSLYHVGYNSNIKNTTGYLRLLTDNFSVNNEAGTQIIIKGNNDDGTGQQGVQLYYGGNQKFTTTNTGAVVTGILTATSFSGDGSALTGVSSPAANRNFIINGSMRNWQRGHTFNSQGNGQNDYTTDRWAIGHNNSHMAAVTRQDGAGADTKFAYCARVQRDSGNSQTDQMRFHTALETKDVEILRGEVLTISYYARKGANYSEANSKITGVRIATGENVDGDPNAYSGGHWTNATTILTGTPTLTTNWQRFSHTTSAVSHYANSMIIEFRHTPTGTAGANDYYEVTGVQLEIGSSMTAFEHRRFSDELARCQRYFQIVSHANAMARTSSNTGGVWARLAVEMRTSPSIDTMHLGNFTRNAGLNLQGDNATNTTQSSGNMGSNYSRPDALYVYDIGNFSGMNVGRTYTVGVPGNNSVAFIADAEL